MSDPPGVTVRGGYEPLDMGAEHRSSATLLTAEAFVQSQIYQALIDSLELT